MSKTDGSIIRVGDRVELVSMRDDPSGLQKGDRGTVTSISQTPYEKQIWVRWDKGFDLALLDGTDEFKKMNPGQMPKVSLTKKQEAENWLRDLFHAHNNEIPKKELEKYFARWRKVFGAEAIRNAWKGLQKDGWVGLMNGVWEWHIPTNPPAEPKHATLSWYKDSGAFRIEILYSDGFKAVHDFPNEKEAIDYLWDLSPKTFFRHGNREAGLCPYTTEWVKPSELPPPFFLKCPMCGLSAVDPDTMECQECGARGVADNPPEDRWCKFCPSPLKTEQEKQLGMCERCMQQEQEAENPGTPFEPSEEMEMAAIWWDETPPAERNQLLQDFEFNIPNADWDDLGGADQLNVVALFDAVQEDAYNERQFQSWKEENPSGIDTSCPECGGEVSLSPGADGVMWDCSHCGAYAYEPYKNPPDKVTITDWMRRPDDVRAIVIAPPMDEDTRRSVLKAIRTQFGEGQVKIRPYNRLGLIGFEIVVPRSILPEDKTEMKKTLRTFEKQVDKQFRLQEPKEFLFTPNPQGGMAHKEGKAPGDFDPHWLKVGTKIEFEHTSDAVVAQRIAMDHLTEYPDYYKELVKMEGKLKKKNPVDNPFELPIEQAVYVPSTKEADKPVTKAEMDKRIRETQTFLSNLYGGHTTVAGQGGYVSETKGLIKEPVTKVTAFATVDDFEKNKDKLFEWLVDRAEAWGQESIGYEVEGDLYYISLNDLLSEFESQTSKSVGGK